MANDTDRDDVRGRLIVPGGGRTRPLLDRAVPVARRAQSDPEAVASKSYKLRQSTVDRVREMAAEQGVGIGELADWLLNAALDAVENGELAIPVRRVQVEVNVLGRRRVGRPAQTRIARAERERDDDTS